jgi:hypothetical protein
MKHIEKMNLSRTIRDEIRKLMAIHGLWKIYHKTQMKQKDNQVFLEDLFHGNPKTGIVPSTSSGKWFGTL